jgi:hypothetical protein
MSQGAVPNRTGLRLPDVACAYGDKNFEVRRHFWKMGVGGV